MNGRTGIFILFLALLTVIGGFAMGSGEKETAGDSSAAGKQAEEPVVVASKIDTEGALLGQMIVQLLDHEGIPVEDRTEFGTTDIIRKAIQSGEIDMYPEYTGNGGFFYPDTDGTVWKDPMEAWETVKRLDREAHDLVWLQPAPANNTWAIAVRQDLAQANNLRTLDDLGRYVREGGEIRLAGSEEFVSRPDALPAFEQAYDFSLDQKQLLVLSGGNTATTEQAAANRTDGVNAAMAYGTDGQLSALGLTVLEDSRHVQPVYQPAPLIREKTLQRYPDIESILNPVFQSLDLQTLQRLNARIAVQGESAASVAESYLREKGFLD